MSQATSNFATLFPASLRDWQARWKARGGRQVVGQSAEQFPGGVDLGKERARQAQGREQGASFQHQQEDVGG